MLWQLSLAPGLRTRVLRYANAHRQPLNKVLHYIGIPLLLVSSLGLLAKLALPVGGAPPALRPNAAWVVLLAAAVWYLRLDWRVGLLTLVFWTAGYLLGTSLSAGIVAAGFAAGIVAHVIGHYGFEHKPPAVLTEPAAVFEAPVWLLCHLAALDR